MTAPHEDSEPQVVINDRRKLDPETGALREQGPADGSAEPAPVEEPLTVADLELEVAKAEAAERTADLQRVTAEYANYRKRVDRDRLEIGKLASAKVLADLLPVLDDLDRAAAHSDLTGAFKAVADKLTETLAKAGLAKVGAAGDAFDPAQHEAVHFAVSADATEQTVTEVLRAGYTIDDRLLRPATVVVTGPDPDAPAAPVVDEATDTTGGAV